MRDDWTESRLADLCTRVTVGHVGSMRDEYRENGIPFLRSQNVQPFRIDTSGIKYIDEGFHRKLKKSALTAGDVVVVRTGYPGTAALVPNALPTANCADLVVISPGPELDGRFLVAVFNSAWGKSTVSGRLVGVAQQHFNVTVAKEMRIPHPLIGEQQKIAAVLAAYDELIETNLRRIEILEEVAQAIYREWFVNYRYPGHEDIALIDSPLGPIPEGWQTTPVSSVVENVRSSTKAGKHLEGLPYVPIDCIKARSLTLTESKPGSEAKSSLTLFEQGDVLFGAMRPYFHKVALAPRSGVTRSTCLVLRPKRRPWLAYALLTLFRDETIAYATNHSRGSTIPYAAWEGSLADMTICLPSEDLLERFGAEITPMLALAENLARQNANLRATRDLLLPKLISGELDVSNVDIDTSWLAA